MNKENFIGQLVVVEDGREIMKEYKYAKYTPFTDELADFYKRIMIADYEVMCSKLRLSNGYAEEEFTFDEKTNRYCMTAIYYEGEEFDNKHYNMVSLQLPSNWIL